MNASTVMPPILEGELEILLHWIRERESIRESKEAGGPRPWTADPLLRDYRWCNVSRMDDRVSRELMQEWYADSDGTTQLVAATLGRLINWPEALRAATGGKPFSLDQMEWIKDALKARAKQGFKVFTGAFVVPGKPGMNKVDSVMGVADRVRALAGEILGPTLRETWSGLMGIDLIGSFLAGQICADLAHLQTGAAWPDRVAWAPIGPGSARGMNRLRGRPFRAALPQAQFDDELADYVQTVRPLIAAIDDDRQLGSQDYQGTLCEFDKYRRLMLGEGQVRARYDGAGGSEAQGDLFG